MIESIKIILLNLPIINIEITEFMNIWHDTHFAFELWSLLHKIVISLKYVSVSFQMGSIPEKERTRGHY